MCKNEDDSNNKDESLFYCLISSLNSNKNPESWPVHGREFWQRGEIEDALSNLYYGASNSSINALLCFGQMCEDDPNLVNSHFYFRLVSLHLLNTMFITVMNAILTCVKDARNIAI